MEDPLYKICQILLGDEIKVCDLKMGIVYGVVWGVYNGLGSVKSFMRDITYSRSFAASAQVTRFGQLIILVGNIHTAVRMPNCATLCVPS